MIITPEKNISCQGNELTQEYRFLAAKILHQAVKDYRKVAHRHEIEVFFKDRWFSFLCSELDIHPETFIQRIKSMQFNP